MNLRETQEALETQWLDLGVSRYKHMYTQAPFSDTDIGSYITGKAMVDMESFIKEFSRSIFRTNLQKGIFLCLTPTEISAISLKFLMNAAFSGRGCLRKQESTNCISSLSIKLGNFLLSHFNYTVLRKKNPKAYEHMVESLKDKDKRYYYRTIRWYKSILGHQDLRATTDELAAIGFPVLKGAVEHTGLFEVLPKFVGNRTMNILFPSARVFTHVMTDIDKLSLMHPVYMPMVCPPEPWTSVNRGGYLTMQASAITHQESTALELEESGALGSRLETLNRLGSVPWEVNTLVLKHMQTAYDNNHPSVPISDLGVSLPKKPWETYREYQFLMETRPDVVHDWKQATAIAYNKFFKSRTVGQRLSFLRLVSMAKRFSQYEAIWFPYRMDYRGRCYSMANGLTPQGDEMARSLLRFHKRTPLSPNDSKAWDWYLIHGANLMGVDKVSFSERIRFSRLNHTRILQCAADPFSYQWWTEADKPWCFLAWAMEYASIVLGNQSYTQLPVSRDGRCNGLQHLSATVRDRETASLVSLVPLDKPSDIYTKVLRTVEGVIPDDSYWKGKVTRKLVKRNTMTTPYNVTINGMGQQIQEELLATSPTNMLTKDDKIHAVELRKYNHSCIMGLLGKTSELMVWYGLVAQEYMAAGQEISWLLPDGFRVIQRLPKMKTKKVMLEKRTVVINYRVPLAEHDGRRNTSAFSPNVTHSMDATHLAMVISKIPDGMPFVTIHDSYGMTAPDVVALGEQLIAQEFARLYETYDILTAIQEDFRSKTVRELPPPPVRGDLLMDDVRQAAYAFA